MRVLLVEDSEDDAALLVRELRRGGYDARVLRVETPEAMNAALDAEDWDIVLADYVLPRFSALGALVLLKKRGIDLPLIIVTGSVGEGIALAVTKAGARDYIMKGDTSRLSAAIDGDLQIVDARCGQHRRKHRVMVADLAIERIRKQVSARCSVRPNGCPAANAAAVSRASRACMCARRRAGVLRPGDSAPGSGGNTSPFSRASRWTRRVTTPASTCARQSSGSNERTRLIRSSESTTPPPTGTAPPAKPVPPPRGVSGTSCS